MDAKGCDGVESCDGVEDCDDMEAVMVWRL